MKSPVNITTGVSLCVMRRRTKLLVIAGTVLLGLLLAMLFFANVRYVDQKPAVAFGEDYFSKLMHGQVDDAFAMYTDGFLQKCGADWRKQLTALDSQNRGVTESKMFASSLAPVTLRDSTEILCILVRY